MPDRFREEGLRFLKHQIASLSLTERAILDLVVSGASNETISEELDISPSHVADYIACLMRIFGAKDIDDLGRKVSLAQGD
jgi:DNA-binding CsgD family transcriptional regulator